MKTDLNLETLPKLKNNKVSAIFPGGLSDPVVIERMPIAAQQRIVNWEY
jgi:hypothetical protein